MNPFDAIRNHRSVAALAERLQSGANPVVAEGVWGSCAAIVAALAVERVARPLLLITAHSDDADDARDDIESATGWTPALLPALESLPGDDESDDDLAAERLRLCAALRTPVAPGGAPAWITASIHALMQPVPTFEAIAAASFSVRTGARLDPDELSQWLVAHGFSACEQVETPGDFARRGGILDVYGPGSGDPVRIEFFGDEVESIRLFESGTQRSSHKLDRAEVPALRAASQMRDTTSFLALLPRDAVIALREPSEVQELGQTYWQRMGERSELIPAEAILRRTNDFTALHLRRFVGGERDAVRFDAGVLPHFEPRAGAALETLRALAGERRAVVLCENAAEAQRFDELLREQHPPVAGVETIVGAIHHGFTWPGGAFVPHHELLSRFRRARTLRKVAPARPIDSFFDLSAGDPVVHVMHGIGRFQGLKTIERAGRRDEYLAIEFAEKAVVHVPVSQIDVVQKYVGSVRGRPKLSKLGGSAWKRAKERVTEAVTDLAAELLAIQAQRQQLAGVSYPQDTRWQQEFEGSFPFKETDDQLRALSELKSDLCSRRPMDRLICGDVGFGKTELAIRACFKVVEYGKQCAVLVPTTVLAEQHFQTFRERLADYPFSVEALSRFRTRSEQAKIIERARKGQVDVLIGTHRLLSADVQFADLGLVVIDEEQRFGVEAKERLKRLRATVDVLTLSATPIPRTLHLSMLGIRDISSLATPPLDRRAIVTQVRLWDDALIREALVRELSRDGQVYFVHNFVRDIHNVANHVRALVPDARVVVGHGQMPADELEDVMLRFMRREADVLVATNIIESGLDIPSANSILINRADRFGLADLHQLRGRVGRSKHRAYCYLLLSPRHPVRENAAKRLKAIEQYSALGAGFQIAMRDLEIRGAGNILGPEQSGHIEAVGYEMYCQLLDRAARRLRDEPETDPRPVNLELGIAASIPRAYIAGERQRMEVYKRLAAARALADVETLRDDLRDAFGTPPDEVGTLLRLAEVRVLAQPWGIRSITLDGPDVVFAVDDIQAVTALFTDSAGSPRVPDHQTVHWRLPRRLMEGPRLIDTLRDHLIRRPGSAAAVTRT